MTTQDVLDGVAAWIVATCDPTILGSYAYLPDVKDEPLPDVVVDLLGQRTTVDDPRFPFVQIQQAWLHVWTLEPSIMVDNTDRAAAAAQLNGYVDQLRASIMKDGSLDGRVPFVSPFFSFDLSHPFVEWADGTRGREMTLNLAVGELVEAPQ